MNPQPPRLEEPKFFAFRRHFEMWQRLLLGGHQLHTGDAIVLQWPDGTVEDAKAILDSEMWQIQGNSMSSGPETVSQLACFVEMMFHGAKIRVRVDEVCRAHIHETVIAKRLADALRKEEAEAARRVKNAERQLQATKKMLKAAKVKPK